METKKQLFALLGLAALAVPAAAAATPLDLTGFSIAESVTGSVLADTTTSTVTFTENDTDLALYFYSDTFLVPLDAGALSFAYRLTLGDDDAGDFVEISAGIPDWSATTPILPELWRAEMAGTGSVSVDLSSFRGQIISLEWGLLWGGAPGVGAAAAISDIDLATTALPTAVPEPTTLLLMTTGLASLAATRRKKV